MSPPATATLADGGSTLRAVTPETLIRDTQRLLQSAGICRPPRWTHRVVRRYWSSAMRGLPFGDYLCARVQASTEQRAVMRFRRPDYWHLVADPTAEVACYRTDRGRGW